MPSCACSRERTETKGTGILLTCSGVLDGILTFQGKKTASAVKTGKGRCLGSSSLNLSEQPGDSAPTPHPTFKKFSANGHKL